MKAGEQIRKRRLEIGMTQKRLADDACLTVNYISLIENGERRMSQKAAEDVATALDAEWILAPKEATE